MEIIEYKKQLQYKFRKTPKLQAGFERMVCFTIFGDYESFDQFMEKKGNIDLQNSVPLPQITEKNISIFDAKFEKFISHKNLFKNINLNFTGFIGKYGADHKWKSFEDFEDHMTKEIENSKILSYQKSILREHRDLADSTTFDKFRELYELKVNKKKVGDNLSKINAWNNTSALNNSLSEVIEFFNKKTMQDYIDDIEKMPHDAKLIYAENEIMLVEILTYEASEKFGASQFCISYDENEWANYLDINENGHEKNYFEEDNKTFFIIDLNQSLSSPYHKIGITTLPNSKIIFAHDKNDNSIMNDLDKDYIPSIAVIKEHLHKAFDAKIDLHKDISVIDFEETEYYIQDVIANPISFIAKHLKETFDEQFEEYLDYNNDIDNNARQNSYNTFNNIIEEFLKTNFGKELIHSGDQQTIKDLLFVKKETDDVIPIDLIFSFDKINVSDFKGDIQQHAPFIANYMTSIQENNEVSPYLTENFCTSSFSWELDKNTRFKLLSNFLSKEWENENFFRDVLSREYEKLDVNGKTEILKNIHKMPDYNVSFLLDVMENDESYSLENIEFTFQDLFSMSAANVFQESRFKNYTRLNNEIKSNIIQRNDNFKGNGLILHASSSLSKYGMTTSALLKLKAIGDNESIKKNMFTSWIQDFKTTASSPFRPIDHILLKKAGKYDSFEDYFQKEYSRKKKTSLNLNH